jgi:hypothetical protein
MNARTSAVVVTTLSLLAFAPGASRAAENPFAHFNGNWSGTGKITVQNGSSERIRCRGAYRAGETGDKLALRLTCASDSYKFELQSDITYDGGNISGSWNEQSRQIYGQLAGRANPNSIQATAQTVGFTAQISIATRGNSQSVSIRSPGSDISEVLISLSRSR